MVSPEATSDRHPLLSLFAACFWVILWLLSWVKFTITFATITVPRMIYSILSYSMTLTLNFWSFAVIFVLSAVALNYWIRFRYLETYSNLKEPPLVKPDAQELHPDVNTPDQPPNFNNYLDEFLQAVRVFGFLEKPVFHELARHLQTRRLIAGDSLSLDQDRSFYCVVDGKVQVYTRNAQQAGVQDGGWDEEAGDGEGNEYQLLNEVGSGGTLSSLFTILSLFTEEVKMSWQDDGETDGGLQTEPEPAQVSPRQAFRRRAYRADSDVSRFDLDLPSPESRGRRPSVSSSASTVHASEGRSPQGTHLSPSARSDDRTSPATSRRPSRRPSSTRTAHPHPRIFSHGTVARAAEDSTLAVIPAEAFRRLTKKFPKASAHIVQVIMTRFSRVTFNAAHKYLGLTTEVLRTEKVINDIACQPLPASFYEGGGLQHLRQRFDARSSGNSVNVDADYFSYPWSGATDPLLTSRPANPKVLASTEIIESPVAMRGSPVTPFPRHSSRHLVQAGDLFSTAGHSSDTYRPMRTFSISQTPFVSQGDAFSGNMTTSVQQAPRLTKSDDFDLRDEVMSCIAKSIGLLQPPLSGGESVEASPAFSATQHSSQRSNVFGTSFGSLTLLDTGDAMSSVTGGSSSAISNADMSGLDNEVEILYFAAGSTLVKAGERNAGLFYVIDGFLDITLPSDDSSKDSTEPAFSTAGPRAKVSSGIPAPKFMGSRSSQPSSASTSTANLNRPQTHGRNPKPPADKHLFTVKRGGIAGYLASLCGNASYVDIKAKTDTYVGFLPSHALDRLLEKRPIVLLTLAKRLISLLSPLVLHIDASLDWMHVNAGQVLWRPNDESDSFYIVINGRLRAITEKENGGVSILAEYGQGDTVGELDVITGARRRNTVHAIRDTELVRMPQTLFNAISARNPKTTAQLLRMIASRVRDEVDSSSNARPVNLASELGRNNFNLKTVAILPVARHVPLDAFARKLQLALEGIGAPTSYLNQASMSNHLGRHAFTRMGKLKVAGWLAEQEQRYRIVLYVADSAVGSPWTQTCILQADCIMVVGMGDDPSIGEYERLLLSTKTTARKELVLLHPDRSVIPGSTREWLKNRPWIHQHIHIELPGIMPSVSKPLPINQDPAAVIALKNLKDRVQSGIQKYRGGRTDPRSQRPPHSNDFARLARRLCGKSIGLVLGGGGARGISHLGVIRALEEYGIPIDHIAGTSIGSFIGGLYAKEADIISTAGRAKQFSGRMGNVWRMVSDVTYPIVAYTTGHEFNRAIYKAFYDLHIEDMWLPYFCNTTNINTSRMEIHETGYAWRFIRASMTLVGLLPPLCDNGNMLVDGGYIDNLPVPAMFAMGATAVFASDVGSLDDNSPRNFGDSVSGWWLLINRWNPFSTTKNIPAIPEIQSRLAYVSSVKTLEEAKAVRGCLYMQMPVQEYGTLQFGKFEEIQQKGYHAAMRLLEQFDEEGKLPPAYAESKEAVKRGGKKGRSARRNSI